MFSQNLQKVVPVIHVCLVCCKADNNSISFIFILFSQKLTLLFHFPHYCYFINNNCHNKHSYFMDWLKTEHTVCSRRVCKIDLKWIHEGIMRCYDNTFWCYERVRDLSITSVKTYMYYFKDHLFLIYQLLHFFCHS